MKSYYGALILAVLDASSLLRKEDASKLATEIVGILNRCHEINKQLDVVFKERVALVSKHKEEIQQLEEDRQQIQLSCKHLSTTTVGDPSGNGDSEKRCDICGVTL